MRARQIGGLVSLLVAGACGPHVVMGTNFDPAAVAKLTTGMTSAQVDSLLGKPNSVLYGESGRTIRTWSFGDGRGVVGRTHWRSVSALFTQDGKLIRVLSTTDVDEHTEPR